MSERFYWENGQRVPVYDPRDEEVRQPKESREVAILRKIMGFLISDPHPELSISCLCLISSVCYNGRSMSDIAKKHKVTRAAVSKRCVDLCNDFGIDPVMALRSKKGRENCRKARNENQLKEIEKWETILRNQIKQE